MKLKLFTKPDVPLEAECISTAVISQLKVKEAEKKMPPENRWCKLRSMYTFYAEKPIRS